MTTADPTPLRLEVIDERFTCRGDARLERLWTGGRWLEGPVYVPAGKHLLFNDIPNNRTLRWDELSGEVSTFDQPCGYRNGQTLDASGRVLACEQGRRRVVRTEHDGHHTVIADTVGGRRLNSPNDVVERSDGSIWFTDPPYGITSDYEGVRAPTELDGYRVDPMTGVCSQVTGDFERPNGLAFSPDEQLLYIADTALGHVRAMPVTDTGLAAGRVFATIADGSVDGLRLDHLGNVWVAAGPALHCFHPDGTLIGRLHLPETCSNLTFGGPKGNRLFICATTSLYSVLLNVNGATRPTAVGSTHIGVAETTISQSTSDSTAAASSGLWIGFVGYCNPTMTHAASAYEDAVLALLPHHGGRVAVRARRHHAQPTSLPAELHVLWFPNRAAFDSFIEDPQRHDLQARFGEVFTDKIVVELDEPTLRFPGLAVIGGDTQ